MKIRLAKALKIKNRLIKRIRKCDSNILKYNCVQGENEFVMDTTKVMEDRKSLVEDLVALKVAIASANDGIRTDIFRMSELKSMIVMLTGLDADVHEGVEMRENYATGDQVKTEYRAQFGKLEIDEAIVLLESEIDNLQDNMDAHNATTEIELDFKTIS